MKRPAKMIAPPTPTTTPIMVFRVPVLIPLEAAFLSVCWVAVPVGRVLVLVEEPTLVMRLPLIVITLVTGTTTGVWVTSWVVCETEALLVVLALLVCTGVELVGVSVFCWDSDDVCLDVVGVDEVEIGVLDVEIGVDVLIGVDDEGVVTTVLLTEDELDNGVVAALTLCSVDVPPFCCRSTTPTLA